MMKASIYFFMGLLCNLVVARAQDLQPGFNAAEYVELMKISSRLGDSVYFKHIPAPSRFHLVYRSPVLGLRNRWDLWTGEDHAAVISIRGTTGEAVSWLANFYAAMVPAKGQMVLADRDTFRYELATNPRAAVHAGWLVGMGFLSRDILSAIDSLYREGTKNILIMGHSQGGAIAYLLTAYLYHLQLQKVLPSDIRFKTYCSAAPKPGNLYFAYDYEALTQGGWACNVVNAADWVPQTPISLQTMGDFNNVNPFTHIHFILKRQHWPRRWILDYVYGRLNRPTRKAVKNYRHYLGKILGKSVKKQLKGFVTPPYEFGSDYVRTGQQIVLMPDDAYWALYPQEARRIFVNHLHQPYLFLAATFLGSSDQQALPGLGGEWVLDQLPGSGKALETLYPDKRPSIIFDEEKKAFRGYTGCNNFWGDFLREGRIIRFPAAPALTRLACPREGEAVFLKALLMTDQYAVDGDHLVLQRGQDVLLRFIRK
ncbi:MAG: lipase family protein [Flavisolibacter sp.]